MKQIITLFSIVFLLIGCSNDDSDSSEVKLSLVAQGDLNGSDGIAESNLVIKDTESWNTLKAKMSYPVSYYKETEVDFTKYQLIIAFDKVQLYGGYSVDITKIVEIKNHIFVQIEHLKPGGLNASITQPFHIVKIPKSNKKVIFKSIPAKKVDYLIST